MNQILTDEEITLIIRECARGSAINRDGSTSHRIARTIEQAALNKLNEQEPVAWEFDTPAHFGSWMGNLSYTEPTDGVGYKNKRPLYLHPAPSVPEGYQLVPIEPTESMIAAMQASGWMLGNYKAMLSAARSE